MSVLGAEFSQLVAVVDTRDCSVKIYNYSGHGVLEKNAEHLAFKIIGDAFPKEDLCFEEIAGGFKIHGFKKTPRDMILVTVFNPARDMIDPDEDDIY
jgi:hypothetical protein